MNKHSAILSEGFESCLRVIAGATAGKEQPIFAEWSRSAMDHATRAGHDKVSVVDRLYRAGSSIGLDDGFMQTCLETAVEFAAAGSVSPIALKSNAPAIQIRSGLEVVCMADVKPSAIHWLWQNWIALGKVHVLAGEGGRGKSTILCSATAITTTGAES